MQKPHHYFAIDGGSGTHLLAALAQRNPSVAEVTSPRHADLLLIIGPVCQKLVSAVEEVANALPRPAHVLFVEEPAPELDAFSETTLAHVEEFLPGALRIPQTSVEAVLDAVLHEHWSELTLIDRPEPELRTIQLPGKLIQEMSTELAVLSLGPLQPFTAGPLRLFLICDGDQVFSTQVEAGYAYRGIAQVMMQAEWRQAMRLARHLDPLAPIACQLAYVCAIEHLQDWQAPTYVVKLREAALALECVQNTLWWLVRFANILGDRQFTDRSSRLATAFTECTAQLWQQPPLVWILPQQSMIRSVSGRNASALAWLHQISDSLDALKRSVEVNRWLSIRTRGIGVLSFEQLSLAQVSGPVHKASEDGAGDVQSRLVTRLRNATIDVREAAEALTAVRPPLGHAAHWNVPAGSARVTVKGPRGTLGLHLVSSGGEKPVHVEWQRPSAALLPLLPDILAGQKLADAEIIVASLDLAMAEADG